jgi:putative SOS response-associated peptidase YedK
MCGRFTLRSSGEVVAEAFGLPEVPDLLPRFNIAPGHPVAVVREQSEKEGRKLAYLRWGLIPAWADDPSIAERGYAAAGRRGAALARSTAATAGAAPSA